MNIRQHFSAVQIAKHWHRLPREVMESSPWTWFLGNLLWVSLIETGRFNRYPPEIPLSSACLMSLVIPKTGMTVFQEWPLLLNKVWDANKITVGMLSGL